ncbi:hypothetical protein ABT075_47110, partial [Streptomyces sp. NPDC002677]
MNVVHDHPGVSTLVGTPKEIQDKLRKSHADKVMVLTFEHMNAHVLKTLAENMSNVASSMFEVLLTRQDREVVELLADVWSRSDLVSPLTQSSRTIPSSMSG